MQYVFPKDFIFGTSTAAAQIETAFDHDWQGVTAKDGCIFDRTTDHELRFAEDAGLIASLAPYYRMSLLWSKLQRAPRAELDPETLIQYKGFITDLRKRGVKIMMVLHHFTNPNWFASRGGWERSENISLWVDFAKKVVDHFGDDVTLWNTFNEPNVYASNGWITGYFPPFKNNPARAAMVVKNMGLAHDQAYAYIKQKFPTQPVGISHNAILFTSENLLGWFPERLSDWWFMEWVPGRFEQADFFGMSYYARVSHDPMPITYINSPDKIKKLGKPHDDMWEYHPEGLRTCINRYWNKYKKPIIITESGVADSTDMLRQQAIADYARILHECLQDGIDIKGYFWWSTWDNFEWNLGEAMRFGLYACHPETKDRIKRPSADSFRRLAHHKMIEVPDSKFQIENSGFVVP
ncbi:MAG: glycoside hydrolase family 1 protein [Cyclobacteriaceae bacterium]|nr:glycoside hydrolase family 1 protein [Cyclobacteriaceae bacterium]